MPFIKENIAMIIYSINKIDKYETTKEAELTHYDFKSGGKINVI